MHLLYCDETNLEERPGDFLIYGGIGLDAERVHDLSKTIDLLRTRARVPREFRLKFNPGPPKLSHESFVALKQNIIEAAAAHGAKLLVYFVLHDIAKDPDKARRHGINTVCYNFDCMLNPGRWRSPGLVLIDRFTDTDNIIDTLLREKFSTGVRGLPFSPVMPLSNIVGFHYSTVGQSHFPSLIDIILGSLRFAVNAHTRNIATNAATASKILDLLSPLFVREREDRRVSELSITFSPKAITIERYRVQYQSLKDFLAASGIVAEQRITDCRPY